MRHYLGIASILCLVLIISIVVVFGIATDAKGTIPVLAINPQVAVISMICACPVISFLTIAGHGAGKAL